MKDVLESFEKLKTWRPYIVGKSKIFRCDYRRVSEQVQPSRKRTSYVRTVQTKTQGRCLF